MTTVNGVKKICVGQKIRATAISGIIPVTPPTQGWEGAGWTFAWTISGGNYFANYQASYNSASKTDYVAPNAPTTEWFFRTPESSVTITCVVTPPAPAQQFTLTTSVSVEGPIHINVCANCGNMKLVKGTSPALSAWFALDGIKPTSFILWGGTYEDYLTGVILMDKLEAPDFLGSNYGQFCHVQLRDRTSSQYGVPETANGCDTTFPYNEWQDADGDDYSLLADAPGFHGDPDPIGLASYLINNYGYYLASFDGTYDTFLFYLPPNSAAGSSAYIPIHCRTWNAAGHCSFYTSPGWEWGDDASGLGSQQNYPPLPEWGNN